MVYYKGSIICGLSLKILKLLDSPSYLVCKHSPKEPSISASRKVFQQAFKLPAILFVIA